MDTKELIESYDALPIEEKRRELGREIAEMTLITQQLIKDIKPDFPVKEMDKFGNLFEGNVSESDYLTGLYEDVVELKENLGGYCDFATSFYYDDGNNFDDEEYSTSGFSKVGLIAILTAIVVVGIIVMGILFM